MLLTLVCLLAATVVFVSLSRRLGLGSILGYLICGAVIGPAGLRLVTDVEEIHEISELGVLMLLFLIGLELRPKRLWLMRRAVFGLGTAQLFVTTAVIAGALVWLAQVSLEAALVLGAGLALSSTAIVLPMLGDRDLLNGAAGRDSFAVLLFQDIASVPLVAAIPLLAPTHASSGPVWPALIKAAIAVAAILIVGRYLLRPAYRLVGGAKTQELFTAASLLTVVAAAFVATSAGLPASLGAFAAGVILSESEYRHELEADVAPFEGLLLGFFFISVGMAADLRLIVAEPVLIVAGALALIAAKIAVIFVLEKLRGAKTATAVRASVALAQGSEFGFVLFGVAMAAGVLAKAHYDRAMLIVALSMAASPILFAFVESRIMPRLLPKTALKPDVLKDVEAKPIIIIGFGRFGQIVGRVLGVRNISFHALDPDAENVEAVRRFGRIAFYGDPTRVELLRAVGAADANLLVVTLPDVEMSLKVVQIARREFPNLTIFACARDRRHAHRLMDEGVTHIVRETFFSSLRLTELVLHADGMSKTEAARTVQAFRDHDERLLVATHPIYKDERALIQTAQDAAQELEGLLAADIVADGTATGKREPQPVS